MKKHYLLACMLFCLILLTVFGVGVMIFTSSQLSKVNEEFINLSAHSQIRDDDREFDDMDPLMAYAYGNWEYYSDQRKLTRTGPWEHLSHGKIVTNTRGFYGAILDVDNGFRPIAEVQNFMEITTLKENGPDYEPYSEIRIALVDDTFDQDTDLSADPDDASTVSMTGGKCDGVYAFDGTLSWYEEEETKTFYLSRPKNADLAKTVPYEEWDEFHENLFVELYTFGNSVAKKKMNGEAKEVFIQGLELNKDNFGADGLSGTYAFTKGDITTTYYDIHVYNVSGRTIMLAYAEVFKPLSFVLQENLDVYIFFVLVLLIMEGVVVMNFVALCQAQRKFEIKSQRLTHGIAHELKTPLAITKTCIENWEYIDEDQRSEYSKKIITEVDHMSGLITRLLDLSKYSSGNITINPETVDLMALTKSVCNRMGDIVKERKLDIAISFDRDEYPVSADLDMMNIVISNFISNAVKYADKKIRISLTQSGRKITFSITNDGAKIARSDLKKVWDVFYKTDESRSDRIGSSGVGLSVVKNILDLHKAKYGCDSNEQGTVFWFAMDSVKKEDM